MAEEEMDVDKLLEEVYKPEPPMAISEEKPAPKAEVKNFQLKHRGKVYEYPEDKVLSLAQQGLDYDINQRLLREERAQFNQERSKAPTLDSARAAQLETYDKFLTANPNVAEEIRKQLDAVNQKTDESNPLSGEIKSLREEIAPLKEGWKKFSNEQSDHVLDQDVKSLREKIPEYQWDDTDEQGFSGEHKLLNHFVDGNFPSVRSALLDLYGDQLMETRVQKAKEQLTAELQSQKRKGIVIQDRLMKPNTFMPNQNISNLSYDDILRNVKKEYLGG